MAEESVKVAVRVRPFNQRERDRKAKLIIKMQDKTTTIEDPENTEDPKSFTFDYSYWSHDGYTERADGYMNPASGTNYASQQKVFDDLGKGVLHNAFEGFNCSLFAYGQTGSGKSYSMVGYGANKGIVPITCEELFKKIGEDKEKYQVTFSMLEVYNEQVNDLLSKEVQKGGLQVRQHPSQGYFYAQGLKQIPVGSYAEIEAKIDEGTANRTVASTNMNATSSRAHTVVTIKFDQIFNNDGAGETKKSSTINLIDLAGSERADSTGATGDRLKEGANINKSLSSLGNVISALAELSSGSKKKIVVPYRDSVLTKLLQNALGGNSKTVMIAALSPADINYVETLSTLRYADRAKRIKTKAVVNENGVDKLIRELKEENERLKQLLENGGMVGNMEARIRDEKMTKEQVEAMRKEMYEEAKAQFELNLKLIQEANVTFEERLKIAQTESAEEKKETIVKEKRKKTDPYLTNLNEDPILSYVISYFIGADRETRIGRAGDSDIRLNGLNILSEHAVLVNTSNKASVTIRPCQLGAKIKVNGVNVDEETRLKHKDRVLIGSSAHMYVFINPTEAKPNEARITWEMAQTEIAEAKGLTLGGNRKLTLEQQRVQEQIIELISIISDVNAIAEELNKHRLFEVVLVPAVAYDDAKPNSTDKRVMVKMINLQNQNAWLWDRGKLMNRKFVMQDHYQKYMDGEDDVLFISKEQDPFWDPPEDLFCGLGVLFLQSLAYRMDFEDKVYIYEFQGQEIGKIDVEIVPCDADGVALGEKAYTDDPNILIGAPFNFMIKLKKFQIMRNEIARGFRVRYRVIGGNKNRWVETPVMENDSEIAFNFNDIVAYDTLTKDDLKFFETGVINLVFYCIQRDTVKSNILGLSTKELKTFRENQMKHAAKATKSASAAQAVDVDKLKLEFDLVQRKYAALADKDRQIHDLIAHYTSHGKMSKDLQVFINEMMRIMNKKPNK